MGNFNQYGSPLFRQLSDDQLQQIHFASLEILERTGVRLFLQEAVDILKKAGASVFDDNRVCIPSHLVEWALKSVPRRVVLCDREGNRVMPLEGHKSFFGPGSDCLNIIDHRTGDRRKSLISDIVDAMKVCESLPNIDFVMSMFLPWDVPGPVLDRYQMEVMLAHTRKPIVFVTPGFEGCVDCVEMAEAVAGGPIELSQNPYIACYINVTSDLIHNKDALQKLLYLDRQNYDNWAEAGKKSILEAAAEKVEEILNKESAMVLPPEILQKIRSIRERAEASARSE